MYKPKWLYLILSILIVFLGLVFYFRFNHLLEREKARHFHELPVMNIVLNGTTLEEIKENGKDTKYEGNDLVLIDKNTRWDFSDIEIKGRGNSTWGGDKRPFQIKFKDKVDLLGLGPRRKYILLANYYDDTFLRNDIMFKLAEMLEEEYRCKGEFIEFYIDNEYQGLYYLTTKVEIGKNSVDLRDKYGILVELDTLYKTTEDCRMSKAGECLVIKDAVFEDDEEVLEEAFSDFLRDFNRLEGAAKKGDYHTIKELIDVRSFAIYYLVSEFAVNPDAYVSSFYFYKDGINDRIHAGPLWDYDFAFGNKKWIWTSNPDFYSPIGTMVQKSKKSTKNDTGKLMYYLMEIPEFRNEVEIIFREEMSGRKSEFLLKVFNEAAKIKDAAISDSELWRDNKEAFLKDLKYLLDWVDKRYDYFEEEYGEKEWNFNPGVI